MTDTDNLLLINETLPLVGLVIVCEHLIGVVLRDGCTFCTGLSVRIGDFSVMELFGVLFGLSKMESDGFGEFSVLSLRLALGA